MTLKDDKKTAMMNAAQSVSIIIPTMNRTQDLLQCIAAIHPAVEQYRECEIIVSDDGDAEQTRATLSEIYPDVIVLQGPRRGPAANRNHGSRHAKGSCYIFLDDDCIPASDLIEQYQRLFATHSELDVFEGKITATGNELGFADVVPANDKGGFLWSCNFGVRRSAFEKVDGFSEMFPFAAMEDVELRHKLLNIGSMQFFPECTVAHP